MLYRSMPKFIDVSGQRFGRLTAVVRTGTYKFGGAMWFCRCDCGGCIEAATTNLRSGNTQSCGCKGREQVSTLAERTLKKHGHARAGSRSAEYKTWKAIRSRCHDPKTPHFAMYGARGIRVCEEWRESFKQFLADMGHRPPGRFSLDRIDNSKGYEPGNCRWATYRTQQNNRSNNRIIEFDGRSMTLAEWGRVTGVARATLERRIDRYGWSIERALTTPVARRHH